LSYWLMKKYLLAAPLLLVAGTWMLPLTAQDDSQVPGTPSSVIVTVESKKNKEAPPTVNQQDVMAYMGRDRVSVAHWLPLQGEHAGLELMILLDDGSGLNLSTQLNDIRNFINAQPPTTAIGVGYMRN
jgi:hypothetical protein